MTTLRSVSELRELCRKQPEFGDRLRDAHERMVGFLCEKIVAEATKVLRKNENATRFNLWNCFEDFDSHHKFKHQTLFYGFWDSTTRQHNRKPHTDAGIEETPLEAVNRVMGPLGYRVSDISDPDKSFKMVLRVEFLDSVNSSSPGGLDQQ